MQDEIMYCIFYRSSFAVWQRWRCTRWLRSCWGSWSPSLKVTSTMCCRRMKWKALPAIRSDRPSMLINPRAKSERRLHEEERLRLTTALHEQEAFALLGRMTATLSHELRTPVATISNLVQTLPTRMDDAQFAKRFVEIIREELARMQRMIENLLVYGKDLKIDAPEWVELHPLLSVIAKNYGLSLSGAHASIYGDGFYLQLLFTNLLRNSADAGAHEVHLRIRSDEDDVYAILEYEDDGEGFAAEANLNELRSPFVTTRSKGAGLGLYLAEKVVCAHGGIIELYRPARGAGVRLWLSLKSLRISHTRLEGASRATVSSF